MSRIMLASVLLVLLAAMAVAGPVAKEDQPPLWPNDLPPAREGGETEFDAVVIESLPFTDTGNTCDNNDDNGTDTPECPYTPAPEVFYSYTPTRNEVLTIDLCGSSYDTKLWCYGGDEFRCNDDFYFDDPACGNLTSRLEDVIVREGDTLIIAVDGWTNQCGDYVIEVTAEELPCAECPDGAVLEGEAPYFDGYVDTFNGGCFVEGDFSEVVSDGHGVVAVCGQTMFVDFVSFDQDWYRVTLDPAGTGILEITFDAEERTTLTVGPAADCEDFSYPEWNQLTEGIIGGPCLAQTLTVTGEPGSDVWIFVAPILLGAPPSGLLYDYTMSISGLGTVAVEATTLTEIKQMFH